MCFTGTSDVESIWLSIFKAVCDSNTTMTPRVQSPAVSKPRLPKKKVTTITNTKLSNLARLESDLPNLMSRRHQAPPLPLDDDSDENDINTGATHRVLKPNTGAVYAPGSNIRKSLKRYGADSQDRNDYVTKYGGHSRSGGAENIAPKRTDQLQNKLRVGNDARTRTTLDSLLLDADESSHDLLANVSTAGRKVVKNDVNSSRQKVGITGTTRTVPQRGM